MWQQEKTQYPDLPGWVKAKNFAGSLIVRTGQLGEKLKSGEPLTSADGLELAERVQKFQREQASLSDTSTKSAVPVVWQRTQPTKSRHPISISSATPSEASKPKIGNKPK